MIYEIVLIFKENSFGSAKQAYIGFLPFDMAFEDEKLKQLSVQKINNTKLRNIKTTTE